MSFLTPWFHLIREQLQRGPVLRALVALFALSLVAGVALDRVGRTRWPGAQARALAEDGRGVEAEAIALAALEANPADEELLFFVVQNHRKPFHRPPPPDREGAPMPAPKQVALATGWVDEARLDRLLEDPRLSRQTAALARFVLEGDSDLALEALVKAWAAGTPPVPWANRLLGRAALARGDWQTAAKHLEREGLFVDAHAEDVDASLLARLAAGDVAGARARLADPAVARRASARARFQIALDARDFRAALRASFGAFYERPPLGPLALAAVAAAAWLAVLARIGKLRERPGYRSALYATAFVLGIGSIWPTLWLLHLQEIFLHLHVTGDAARDAIFYVFGVGFREELSKLLAFALLVPLLGRRAKPIDVAVAGGLVGLGFAAEENVMYLAHGDLPTALGRYLTANFLHMSMTGLAAVAAYDVVRDPERHAFDATRTLFIIIALHGAYDFLLSHGDATWFAYGVFIYLARKYLETLWRAQGRPIPGMPTESIFGIGTGLVIASSFVWGAARVGPGAAAEAMIGGLLGVVLMLVIFVRTLAKL